MTEISYPEWVGRLDAHLTALLDALDRGDDVKVSIVRQVARRDLDRLEALRDSLRP